MQEKIRYSEIFYSIQGEGSYTGVPTLWVRFFGCNLQCNGFGQQNPSEPSTYVLPYKDFDVSTVSNVEELPVWKYGCDSSYSWSKKFKHLMHEDTAEDLVNKLLDLIPDTIRDGQRIDLCFTGGEPLLDYNQEHIIKICRAINISHHPNKGRLSGGVTIETNGTKTLKKETKDALEIALHLPFLSVSPKLNTVSGECNTKAFKPDVLLDLMETVYNHIQLKFVMGKDPAQWEELEAILDKLELYIYENSPSDLTPGLPQIFIMPVGATEESQDDIAGEVASMALARGYAVSARVHCYLWGNTIGV